MSGGGGGGGGGGGRSGSGARPPARTHATARTRQQANERCIRARENPHTVIAPAPATPPPPPPPHHQHHDYHDHHHHHHNHGGFNGITHETPRVFPRRTTTTTTAPMMAPITTTATMLPTAAPTVPSSPCDAAAFGSAVAATVVAPPGGAVSPQPHTSQLQPYSLFSCWHVAPPSIHPEHGAPRHVLEQGAGGCKAHSKQPLQSQLFVRSATTINNSKRQRQRQLQLYGWNESAKRNMTRANPSGRKEHTTNAERWTAFPARPWVAHADARGRMLTHARNATHPCSSNSWEQE
jgi:hypothetical protein